MAVNNAGTEGTPGPVTEQTAESYAATFDTNVLGTLLSMKHELRIMLAQGHGSIVNVSSTYGRIGAAGASVYVASKHAVEGLTKAAALEVAESGVRVNVVAPGPIETGMLNRFTGTAENKAALVSGVPLKRVGTPEEIAQTIVFVASDKASFITGASIAVDGGKLCADSVRSASGRTRPSPEHFCFVEDFRMTTRIDRKLFSAVQVGRLHCCIAW